MQVTLSNRNAAKIEDVLTYTVDDDATAGVNLRGFPILGLLIPIVNGTPTIRVQISIDGSNWYELKNADGSTNSISITGGGTPIYISSDVFTPLAGYTGHLADEAADIKIRLFLSAAQVANRTFTWIVVG